MRILSVLLLFIVVYYKYLESYVIFFSLTCIGGIETSSITEAFGEFR